MLRKEHQKAGDKLQEAGEKLHKDEISCFTVVVRYQYSDQRKEVEIGREEEYIPEENRTLGRPRRGWGIAWEGLSVGTGGEFL